MFSAAMGLVAHKKIRAFTLTNNLNSPTLSCVVATPKIENPRAHPIIAILALGANTLSD